MVIREGHQYSVGRYSTEGTGPKNEFGQRKASRKHMRRCTEHRYSTILRALRPKTNLGQRKAFQEST